jgi:hypothetical protein
MAIDALVALILVQVGAPAAPGNLLMASPSKGEAPANVRCVKDGFGNYACTDGSRVIRDSFGNVTIIPGRK